jgi:phosphoribosylformylglycinamidine synthase I
MLDSEYNPFGEETRMKFGVIIFPGSNCDHDAYWTIQQVAKQPVTFLWHESHDLQNCDAVIVPGGFAFGDYLRTGAIAKFSPVMESVKKFADGGGLVLGICNGFQILLESGLLPGAMLRNQGLRFLCRPVHLRVETTDTPFTCNANEGQVLKMPIAHMAGNYFCDAPTLAGLEENDQIILRYTAADGGTVDYTDSDANPNGSIAGIAGICNRERNVLGMMPHPERAIEAGLGSVDGLVILNSMVHSLTQHSTVSA